MERFGHGYYCCRRASGSTALTRGQAYSPDIAPAFSSLSEVRQFTSSLASLTSFAAEEEGFEPSIPFGMYAFQAYAFSHSATLPYSNDNEQSTKNKQLLWGGVLTTRFLLFVN